ncbi:hypothetical protein WICMUC_001421 [Wickerhamomyces mucosus]|uniref:Altered inheritance of mitochondria protein 44 n=1 Tax=Wickerhamomyces mucosus TaxID=1378264 RepID=A0A9P8PW82_9ASCO|nr:hypothetical protein WICMUC_001421 [Wickerhamomyces mucosus]
MTKIQHKRADTYEGSQMTFQFPSTEDLERQKLDNSKSQESIEAKPFFKYNATRQLTPSQTGEQFFGSEAPEFDETNSETSIATESNVSYQITGHSTESFLEQVNTQSEKFSCSNYQYHSQFKTISQPPSPIEEEVLEGTPMKPRYIRRLPSGKTKQNVQRSQTVKSNGGENTSLFTHSSLKRSKAVKYKIPWLQRLKNMGINTKVKIRKWRLVTAKKVLKFKSKFGKTSRIRKCKISLPLERGKNKSISELRKEIIDEDAAEISKFSKPKELPSSLTNDTDDLSIPFPKRIPPPLPQHRIASNPSIKKFIEEQELRSKFQKEQQFLHEKLTTAQDVEQNLLYDEDERNQTYQYFNVYLKNVIAQRIFSKLNMYRICHPAKAISETEFSDVASLTNSSSSEFENYDLESVTTVSDEDEDEFDISVYGESEVTDHTASEYFSAYDSEDAVLPNTIKEYQQTYVSASIRRPHIRVKRSSTLPINAKLNIYRVIDTISTGSKIGW